MTPILYVGDELLAAKAVKKGVKVVKDARVLGWLSVEYGLQPPALFLDGKILTGDEVERWLDGQTE
jgi:predicted thioredoxin/glutaredoxin